MNISGIAYYIFMLGTNRISTGQYFLFGLLTYMRPTGYQAFNGEVLLN